MKILHIVQTLKPGGIEQFALSMLNKDIQNVYILALSYTAEETFSDWKKPQKFRDHLIFANKKPGIQFELVRLIKRICQNLNITVIHTHHIGPLFYGSMAVCMMKSVRHIHTEHDIWHLINRKDRIIQSVIFKLEKKIRLVAISRAIYNNLKSRYPNANVTLVPNAVDTHFFSPGNKEEARRHLNLPADAFIIGSAGSLYPAKGHEWLIKAMPLLPSHFYLAIAGRGDLHQELLNLAESLGLSNRVCLLGIIDAMNEFYRACDICCFPSINEGLPLALLEAQACNVPVVCSDVGSCAEAVDPESGILVGSKNSQAIAAACLQLSENKRNPRDFVVKYFSFDEMLAHYYQLYENE